jgi:hypothetical protein
MMTALGELLLAVLIGHTGAGKSVYSFEPMQACGVDPAHPSCALERVCDTPSPVCQKPRFSRSRAAWVRVETRETALRRYRVAAEAMASVATRLVTCQGDGGELDEDCWLADGWPRGRDQDVSLALAGATVVLWESGGREDIWAGHPPVGLGPAGEVCAMQIMPEYAPRWAGWLPKEERERLMAASVAERRAWAHREMLGQRNLHHCFEVGLRILSTFRRSCWRSTGSWSYKMFSKYGTGGTCSAGQFAVSRQTTFDKLWRDRKSMAIDEADALIVGLGQGPGPLAFQPD